MPASLIQVKQALALPDFDAQAAQAKMAPIARAIERPPDLNGRPRLGGVLLMLFQQQQSMQVLLTRRRDHLSSHAGQISFPGGRNEAPESLADTALRETEEEVGIAADVLQVIGSLTPIYIPPSDYEVHPFVAIYAANRPPRFRAAPDEVAEIIAAPLADLLNPETRREEPWQLGGNEIMVPYFAVRQHKVWGATAIMLSEFLERLRQVLN